MFFKRTLLAGLLAGLALTPLAAAAQTQTLEGISGMGRAAISPIYAGNEVKGYILYAKADKADRKTDNYRLDFYDQDLTKVSTLTLQKPAGKFFLVGNTFNGSAFALYFYNQKEKALEIETYDPALKKLGAKTIPDLSDADRMALQQTMQQGGDSQGGQGLMGSLNLFAVPGHGFVRNSFEGKFKGYNLQLYDDQLNPKWRLSSDPKAKRYEAITLTGVTDKYLLGMVMRRDGLLSRKIDSYLVAIDLTTGRKVLDLPVETSASEQLALSSFSFDAAKREFVALGEYYRPDDKPFIGKSQGFFIKRFGETGKVTGVKNYGWQKEVKALLPAEARQSLEDGFVNFTQAIVRGADGRTYIVAEQYKVSPDGVGMALGMLGGRMAASAKARIGNLLVLALAPDYRLTDVKCYVKDESKAGGPLGATGLLGLYFKSTGQFDYQFLQKNDANTQFNAVYINYDKEKGEQTKKIIGNIAFGDNGEFKLDKVDGTSSATASYVYPAKPGYVLLADFLKKQSQLALKLVKLNI